MRIWKFDRLCGIKYYIPAKSEILQICQFTSRNESKRWFKSGSNLNQIWSVFQIWIDQLMRAIWVCSILLQMFLKTFIQLFTNFLQFFDVRGKNIFASHFFLAIFCKKLHFVDMCPRSKFSHFSMFFHRFFFNAPRGIICRMRASELRKEAKKSNR